jgi:two-component sensor histidine kinase
VSDKRLRRFFERTDDNCRIKKELRDWVIFAPQNLLQDPPFFRLDLVSCRNFLIYLQDEAQQKVLALFHFALNEGGHLFLGTAETIGRNEELFETTSKKWRIYRRVGPTQHDIIDFPITRGRRLRPSPGMPIAEPLLTSHTAEVAQRARDFSGRLQALGSAHALLTARSWQSLDLRAVILEPLRAHAEEGDRARFQGPEVELRPGAALAMSLAIHELATNAAKHGALSTPTGAIAIDWVLASTEGGRLVRLVWRESGGPEVEAPAEHGFGLSLIERIISYELDGEVRYDFAPEGFACELRLPLHGG